MEKGIFSGVRAKWGALYRAFYERALQKIGAFQVRETSGSLLWRHTSSFAEIRANRDGLVAAIPSDARHPEWEPAKMLETSKNRVVHYFHVTDSAQLEVLIPRVVRAYELTRTARPSKAPAEKRVERDHPGKAHHHKDVHVNRGKQDLKAHRARLKPSPSG